ncbi:prepilin-type N-terminal cleavage/methylation domain-containing protein [Desulfococcaceae bacterium HSG9]|nr:prepilin-type N-terminal cleavage/methylation domain-containing protein [Desulfococcaceae bacterium HSG9]
MQVKINNSNGFTLLEILIALAISLTVIGAAYSTFLSQQKSYIVQEEIVGMQQNLRAAMFIMQKELRMAKYDPSPNTGNSPVGIISLSLNQDGDNQISFDYISDTTGSLETITYSFDAAGHEIERQTTGSPNPIADNIDALNFVGLNSNGVPATALSEVVSIQITIVAKADRDDINHTDATSYTNPFSTTAILAPQNDHRRRRMLTTKVKCRNISLP